MEESLKELYGIIKNVPKAKDKSQQYMLETLTRMYYAHKKIDPFENDHFDYSPYVDLVRNDLVQSTIRTMQYEGLQNYNKLFDKILLDFFQILIKCNCSIIECYIDVFNCGTLTKESFFNLWDLDFEFRIALYRYFLGKLPTIHEPDEARDHLLCVWC